MRRRSRSGDDGSDEVADREPSGPPRSRRHPHAEPRESVRPWRSGEAGADQEGEEDAPGGSVFHRPRRPIFYRARDSLYFEPLVALAIIVLMLVSLWAYTQNWPPMYVVESNSMQHGDADQLGLINTGDLVLAQKIDPALVTTYVVGLQTGYMTYGEYGDVILYHADGVVGPAPVIHRALLYLDYNAGGTFTIPSLQSLPCGNQSGAVYTLSSSSSGCGWSKVSGTLTLHRIGWKSVDVAIDLASVGRHGGFITMGDNNLNPGSPGEGIPDQPALSSAVDPNWVVGVARGMLPWFGSVKLLLEGQATEVPPQSWQFMGLTLIAIVLAGLGIHYILRAPPDEEPPTEGDEDGDDSEPEHASRWSGMRLWRRRSEDPDDDEGEESGTEAGPLHRGTLRGGRPHPTVRRAERAHPGRRKDADSDDPDL